MTRQQGRWWQSDRSSAELYSRALITRVRDAHSFFNTLYLLRNEKREMKILRTVSLMSLLVVFGLATTPQTSFAQTQVIGVWGVEAPITAVDPAARTITAGGMDVTIPATMVIGGTNGITGASMDRLLDAAAPSRLRSLFASDVNSPEGYSGGTLKAEGNILSTPDGRVFEATGAIVELAENVVLGLLDEVNPETGEFIVNGVTCKLNVDERFPGIIVDAGNQPIGIEQLPAGIGQLVAVVGYMYGNSLHAIVVETEIVPTTPGSDTVRITRALGRNRGGNRSELRVQGLVSPFDANATVTITDANTNAVLATVNVAAAGVGTDGVFDVRLRNLATVPERVKATSSNGGTHELDVNVR